MASNFENLSDQIVDALKLALINNSDQSFLPLHSPNFSSVDKDFVFDCLESSFVSSVGAYVDKFERQICDFTGAKFAVATVNGTAALSLALLCAGTKRGEEVFVPSLSFIATANAVSHIGAIPHFVDIEDESLGMDPLALRAHITNTCEIKNGKLTNKRTGKIISAVIPMHCFGHPCNIFELNDLAEEFKLNVIEDAAEALGSFVGDTHVGMIGKASIFSFNGNKILTTGGGGMIVTNDESIYLKARHLSTTAKITHPFNYEHDEIGFNYRMPNLNAALGCAQILSLKNKIRNKRKLYQKYKKAFAKISDLYLLGEPKKCYSNYWLQTVILSGEISSETRDEIIRNAANAGFMCRPAWGLLHEQAPYKKNPQSSMNVSSSIVRRILNIPSSAWLK